MAICVFSTISYSIVKCWFVCLFVNALGPCKINIEKYTALVLCYFYAFQLNIDRTTAVPSLVRMYVCLSGCVSVMLDCGVGGLCMCACVSACLVL